MSVEREVIVAAARRWIGTPYRHQASLIHVGCDCLGLVRGVWREVIGDEPEAAPPIRRTGRRRSGWRPCSTPPGAISYRRQLTGSALATCWFSAFAIIFLPSISAPRHPPLT